MTLRYKFLEDIATADVAFLAEGDTLEELLEAAAMATTNVMVRNMNAIESRVTRTIKVTSDSEEGLLYRFLDDIIFYKDAEQLIFGKFEIRITNVRNKQIELTAQAHGEKLDRKKHDLVVDVKAVTYHEFRVERTKGGWKANVILDI